MLPTPPDSLLIIKTSSFGDIICALPTLRALRAAFPQARIGWVVDSRFRDVVRCDPQITQVYAVPLRHWRGHVRELLEVIRTLRRERYQMCLDLQGLLKSGVLSRLAAPGVILQMAGDNLGRLQWLAPAQRIPHTGQHAVERMLALAAALGADVSHPTFGFHVPPPARQYAETLLAEHDFGARGPLVALNPGASTAYKTWPPERFAALARRLREDLDARVVVLGGPTETTVAQAIARHGGAGVLCTAGRTDYLQLAAVLERCETVVTGDTGPMHLAVALGKQVVGLFGPTNPALTGPYGSGHVIIRHSVPCQPWPCDRHARCEGYPCMAAIGVDEVMAGVRTVLDAARDTSER